MTVSDRELREAMENTDCRFYEPQDLRCSFTGYRPQKMPFGFNEDDPRCVDFKKRLRDSIIVLILNGYSHFLSGGANGMDLFAAEAVLDLKEQYPWIMLEMVIPFEGQATKWTPDYQERHARLLARADMVTLISHEYTKKCMIQRNRYLVNNADRLFACYDGKPGGTAMTVDYAKEIGVPVSYIAPVA